MSQGCISHEMAIPAMGEVSDIATATALSSPMNADSFLRNERAMMDMGIVRINSAMLHGSWQDSDERVPNELVRRHNQSKFRAKILPEEVLVEDLRWEHAVLSPDASSTTEHDQGPSSPETPRLTKCHILELPIELIESLCREYIDITTATCLGLTCHAFFDITEHLYPYQVNLHMRTKGQNRKCLGHLLTDWMAPKYSFDHSWGKFLLKRHWRGDEDVVETKWREKEGWRRIKLVPDKIGAVIAYKSQTRGF